MPSAKVPKRRAVILARKDGYFDGSCAEAPGPNGKTYLRLRLMRREFMYSVGTSGGNVKVTGGAELDFPAGGLVTASGAAYTGEAQVAANYLNPDPGTFRDFFAGDYHGRIWAPRGISIFASSATPSPWKSVAVGSYMNRKGISNPVGVIHFFNAPSDMGVNRLHVLAEENGGPIQGRLADCDGSPGEGRVAARPAAKRIRLHRHREIRGIGDLNFAASRSEVRMPSAYPATLSG